MDNRQEERNGICVFDLDGTLLNTVYALQFSMNTVMKELGFPEIDLFHTKQFVGTGSFNFVRKTLLYHGDEKLKYLDGAVKRYGEVFRENCNYRVEPYGGMPEALLRLKACGIRTAVLSNKPQKQVEDNIYSTYGRDMFDRVYGERKGIPLKPDPESLRMLIHEFGFGTEKCLYFGDTNTDMETGKNAGVHTAGVLWGFRDREELQHFSPEALLESPAEIPELALKVLKN